jgi:hypothetical protein
MNVMLDQVAPASAENLMAIALLAVPLLMMLVLRAVLLALG